MRRRRRKRSSELTSLIDVLFILLFASLVQARQTIERDEPAETLVVDAGVADAGPPDAGPPDAGSPDAGLPDARAGEDGTPLAADTHRERARRVSNAMASAVRGTDVFVVEVTATGYVVEIARWHDGARLDRKFMQHRLVDVPPNHSIEYPVYLGEAQPWLRLCPLVLASLSQPQPDLEGAVVFIIVDTLLDDLPLWLRDGLAKDARQCGQDTGGIAILLDPANPIP